MKKVLFALSSMNIGGTEKAFLNLLDTLDPNEYDITLLLFEKKGGFLPLVPEWITVKVLDGYDSMKPEIMDPPLHVVKDHIRNRRFGRAFLLAATHLWFKLTKNRTPYYRCVLHGVADHARYDTAIAYAGPFDFLSVYIAYCVTAKEKVQWIHFDVQKFQFNTETCRKLYRKMTKICVVSESAKRSFLSKLPSATEKTVTCPNVVSERKCREYAELGAGFEDDAPGLRLVTLGRLSQEKGQDIVPEIAVRLRDAGVAFRWYLIGDGQLRPVIEQKIKANALEESVILLGTQPNPYPFLKQADVYVQTSVHEGFCITLAEAKAFDLPIISTDCAGAHEQLDGRANCHVVARTAEELFFAIKTEVERCLKSQ